LTPHAIRRAMAPGTIASEASRPAHCAMARSLEARWFCSAVAHGSALASRVPAPPHAGHGIERESRA
jgi:hypothetical protein